MLALFNFFSYTSLGWRSSSYLSFLRMLIMYIEFCRIIYLHLVKWLLLFWFINIMCFTNWFSKLKQSWIPRINSTWSWCNFLYWWVLNTVLWNILQTYSYIYIYIYIYMCMYTDTHILSCSFLVLSVWFYSINIWGQHY